MSDKMIDNRIDKQILEEAASYYLGLQDDSMSGAELKAWQAWFMRSKDHQLAFRRLETLWGAMENISYDELKIASGDHTNNAGDLEAAEAGCAAENSGGSVLSLMAPAANNEPQNTYGPRWFAGIAASIAAIFIAGYMTLAPTSGPGGSVATPYYTAAGEQRLVRLADGSIVELGPDSGISVTYSTGERALELLRGQAVFTVAKNPNRPFIVRAGSGSVTAIGTVFNVRRDEGDVRVRVLEGTVAVRPQAEEAGLVEGEAPASAVALVTAGSQTFYSDEGAMRAVVAADVYADLAWRTGVLTLVNRELSDVIQEVNRFVQNEVAIGDSAIGDFRFTGTVYPDKIDEWLEGLTQGYPVKVVHVSGRTILLLDDTDTNH